MNFITKKVSFNNTAIAFSNKSDRQLKQSKWLFKIFEKSRLVNFFSKIILLLIKLKFPIDGLIKKTIYKQFCAGETIDESNKIVKKLNELKRY